MIRAFTGRKWNSLPPHWMGQTGTACAKLEAQTTAIRSAFPFTLSLPLLQSQCSLPLLVFPPTYWPGTGHEWNNIPSSGGALPKQPSEDCDV